MVTMWRDFLNTVERVEKSVTQDSNDSAALDIHLMPGANRLPGYVGVDLFPADNFTVVHDIGLGLPFPDKSIRTLRITDMEMVRELASDSLIANEARRVLTDDGYLCLPGKIPVAKNDIPQEAALAIDENADDAPRSDLDAIETAESEAAETYGEVPEFDKMVSSLVLKSELHKPGTANPEDLQWVLPDKYERICKALDGNQIPILGSNKERQIVYGVVLEPMKLDSQDHIMTPRDIEDTCHRFMGNGCVIKSEHDKEIRAKPIESFVAPQDLQYHHHDLGTQTVRKGSWVLGVHVSDPAHWQRVISGDYTGFSVGGFGLHTEL